MARQTLFRPQAQVLGVIHAHRDRFFMRPIARGMRSQPLRRGAMAALAADSIVYIECPCFLAFRNIKSVAGKAFGSMRGVGCAKTLFAQNLCDALRHLVVQNVPGFGVLVLKDPGAVLVLQNLGLASRLDRSVASRSTARSRTYVARLRRGNRRNQAILISSLS